MSLIISVYVREGIVMAADSRLTLNSQLSLPNGQNQILSITNSDSAKKLFLAQNNVGISTCGPADINGIPIAGFIESFIIERVENKLDSAEEVANEIKTYFNTLGVRPGTKFHVAGYHKVDDIFVQTLFLVNPSIGLISLMNQENKQGANWDGEFDILQRLINNVALIQSDGLSYIPLPFFNIPFDFFTLQDAIDFASYGIRSTIDTLRFQTRQKTVGGAIDVLVITPNNARWIAQKQLAVK